MSTISLEQFRSELENASLPELKDMTRQVEVRIGDAWSLYFKGRHNRWSLESLNTLADDITHLNEVLRELHAAVAREERRQVEVASNVERLKAEAVRMFRGQSKQVGSL